MKPDRRTLAGVQMAGRFIGGVMGLVFLGIGLTVLGFLWSVGFDEFGAPPLFFRIFGSLIAIPFVAIGGTMAFVAITGARGFPLGGAGSVRAMADDLREAVDELKDAAGPGDAPSDPAGPTPSPGYACPRCGAPLAEGADISPHGDTKCRYCNCWFNIHGK